MYISNQVAGHSIGDEQSIKPHVQQYIVKNEEMMAQLQNKVEELKLAAASQQSKMEVSAVSSKDI